MGIIDLLQFIFTLFNSLDNTLRASICLNNLLRANAKTVQIIMNDPLIRELAKVDIELQPLRQ